MSIDRILFNGQIVTQNPAQPRVQALAIARERIVAYGSSADMLALAGAHTQRENLNSRMVIPGLTDAHLHWEHLTKRLNAVELHEIPTKAAALARVQERAQQLPAGNWITGGGWFQDIWEGRAFPTAADLDKVTPSHPVYLTAKSGHAAWVNTRALERCGITASTPDPEGGKIVRDTHGQPTGILLELAMDLVADQVPPPSPERLAQMMRQTQAAALAVGMTGFHDYDEPSCLRGLQILREQGELNMRAVKNINRRWLDAALDSGLRWGFGDDWLRIGGLKIFADGALGARTAYMIEPYEGEPDNYGIATIDPEEMTALVSRASAAGFPATIHAIGDRAIHAVLNTYAIVRQEEQARGETPSQRRHRIEHVQVVHPNDINRLAELKIIASMQPIHATSDYVMSDSYWGARSALAYNPRIQLDQGVIVAFGSDAPVEPFNPFTGIHAAITRRRADGSPSAEGWYPAAKVTLDETLRAYTFGAAYAAGMEDRLGQLAPGFLADLVILDRDLYTMPEMEIPNIRVVATMVGGAWRYGEPG